MNMDFKAVIIFLILAAVAYGKERVRRHPVIDSQTQYRTPNIDENNYQHWMTPEGRSTSDTENIFQRQEDTTKTNSGAYMGSLRGRQNAEEGRSLSEAPSAADYVIRALKMRDKAFAPQFHTLSESSTLDKFQMPQYTDGDSSTMQLPTYRTVTDGNLGNPFKTSMHNDHKNLQTYPLNEESTQLNTYPNSHHDNPFQIQSYRSNEDNAHNQFKILNNVDTKQELSSSDEGAAQYQAYDTILMTTQKQAEQVAQKYADEYIKTIEQGTLKLQQEQDNWWRTITGTQQTPMDEAEELGARRIEQERIALLQSKAANSESSNRYTEEDTTETTRWAYADEQNTNNEENNPARQRINNQLIDLTLESEQDRKSTAKRVLPPYQRLATYIGQVEDHRGVDEYKEQQYEEEPYNSNTKGKGKYIPSHDNFRPDSGRYTSIYRPKTRDYMVNVPNDGLHRSNVDMQQLLSHAKDYHAQLNSQTEDRGKPEDEIRYNFVKDGHHMLSIPQSLVSILRQMGSVTAGTPVQEIKVMSMQITPQTTPEPTVQAEEQTTTVAPTQNIQHITVSADKPTATLNNMPITMINGLPVYNPYNIDLQTLRKILSSPLMIPAENGGHYKVVPHVDDHIKQSLQKNEESLYMHLREPQRDSWVGAESQTREVRDSSGRRGKKVKKLKKKHIDASNWGGTSWVEGLIPEPSTQLTPPPLN